jgi:predicted TIM-barrel enzyme
VVVSGAGTGKATDPAKAERVKRAAPETPVFIGSGITAETIAQFHDSADGFIVGTALKENGIATNPVQLSRVRALRTALS